MVSHLLSISRMSFSKGDAETARSSLSKLAEGDFPEDVRSAAKASLVGMLDQLGARPIRTQDPTVVQAPSRSRKYIILANLLVLAIVLVLVAVKKRASK